MADTPKRAAIYARVSTEKQRNNYSIQTQIDKCRQYASDHGYSVGLEAEYREVFSGAELRRTQLDELRKAARRGDYHAVLTIDMDRLSRGGLVDQLVIEDEFKRYGAPFEYVLEHFDHTPEGEFQKQVRAILADFERKKFMQRAERGRIGYVQAGHVVRGRVTKFGYYYANKAEGKSNFEIEPEEAAIVTLIYQWYTTGDETGERLGQWAIAQKLTKLGIPTRYDKDIKEITRSHKKRPVGAWTSITISRILADESYCGVYWYGRHRRVKDEKTGKKRFIKTPPSEWIPVSVPAIISRELWEAARRQAERNEKNMGHNAKYPYLLRGLIRCSRCNGRFHGTPNKGHPSYRCKGANPEKWAEPFPRTCKGTLRADIIEPLVWDTIARLLKTPELIIAAVQEKRAEFKPTMELLRGQLTTVVGKIVEIEGQRARLIDLYLMPSSTLSKELLSQRDAALKAALDEFIAEKAHLEAQLASKVIPENALPEILTVCEQLRQGIDEFTRADKRYALELLNVSITVQRGETRDLDKLLVTGYLPTTVVNLTGSTGSQSLT